MESQSPPRYRGVRDRPRRRLEYVNSTLYQDYQTTNRSNRGNTQYLKNQQFQRQNFNTQQRIDFNPQQSDDYFQRQSRYRGRRRGRRAGGPPPSRPPQTSNTQPMDLEQRTLVRKMFDLIRMIHHRKNVSLDTDPNNQPPSFRRISNYLASIIKPVALNETTQLKIEGNAKNWAYTTQLILVDHYEEGINSCSEELRPLLQENWRQAFHEAKRWAQNQFKRRLHGDAIDSAEALLISLANTEQVSTPPQTRLDGGSQNQTTPTPSVSIQRDSIFQEEDFPPLPRVEVALSPLNPFLLDCQAEIISHQSPLPMRVARNRRNRNPCIISEQDPLLNIESESTLTEDPNPLRNEVLIATHDMETQTDGRLPPVDSASGEPTPLSQACSRIPVKEEHEETKDISSVTLVEKLISLDSEPEEDETPLTIARTTELPLLTVQAEVAPSYRPTRHPQTARKMMDWTLTARKKWLILGDSNLSRFPNYNIPDLQIDSYPGANFRHAEAILGKATAVVQVEKIILSFGILHMEQKPKQTAVKQLQKALKMAKDKFPHAEVWIPLINFSTDLETEYQNNLEELNAHIRVNMPFLPKLPIDLFQTVDKIHWSGPTAAAMLQHWAKHLNLPAP